MLTFKNIILISLTRREAAGEGNKIISVFPNHLKNQLNLTSKPRKL
jgi:hypothetical protein